EDQKLDQVRRLANLLPRGLAFHHAGLLPGLKVMVETLFARGDLRAVFATDTLALGINMPARSVALGSLSKFDGVSMRLLTPNEYQQLTGRAGRRGMDARGTAIIPYSPWDEFEPAFAALTGELLPVISAFAIRYNTILNLWRPRDLTRLRAAVASSLREFQRRGTDVGAAPPTGHHHARSRRKQEETGLSRAAARELTATIWALRHLGYIGADDALTIRGHLLRAIFHPAGMVLTELAVNGGFADLGPAEVAELVSWFTFDDDRSLRNLYTQGRRLVDARRAVYQTLRVVQGAEYADGVPLSPGVADSFYGIAFNWWRGSSLAGLTRHVDLAEGDLLVSLNQTIDLLQQLQAAVGQALDTRALWIVPETDGNRRDDAIQRRLVETVRTRLADLRPTLDAAWRGLLRGSVAQSRMVPSMAVASPNTSGPDDASPAAVALPLAADEDPADARQDRVEDEAAPDTDRPTE
ncbi:MAG TPA: helicase-related protein, partial [Ktedonobacterales bacterium]